MCIYVHYYSKVWEQIIWKGFIQQEHIKLIKRDSKDIYNVTKYLYSQYILGKDVFLQIISSTTVFYIDNNKKWFLRIKSEIFFKGSCDTKDWSNDAENSALPS